MAGMNKQQHTESQTYVCLLVSTNIMFRCTNCTRWI